MMIDVIRFFMQTFPDAGITMSSNQKYLRIVSSPQNMGLNRIFYQVFYRQVLTLCQ